MSGVFLETGGTLVMEAENYTSTLSRGGNSWIFNASLSDYTGNGYMEAYPNNGNACTSGWTTDTTVMNYGVYFSTPGIYYLWIRGGTPDVAADSFHAGLNNSAVPLTSHMSLPLSEKSFNWTSTNRDGSRGRINIGASGVYTFNIWMREDGVLIDKIILTTNYGFTPSGAGPAESIRN